jgi:uncharacterized membrane protein YphA (DoxX/SURF4 family)
MTMTRALARPMLAGIFICGGVDAILNPEAKAKKAWDVAPPLAEQLHLPTQDPVTLVRLNGALQAVGGTMLALGKAPRLASTALIGSLVPTTYAGHRFWEEADPQTRQQQRTHFLKNLAVLGGLILAAVDTKGKDSRGVPAAAGLAALKLTKQAVTATGRAAHHAAVDAREQLQDGRMERLRDTAAGLAGQAADAATGVAERAREQLQDGGAERMRQAAAELAGQAADAATGLAVRAREALPIAG